MNEKLDNLMKKIRATATVTGEYVSKTASTIGKKTGEAFNAGKLNLQIFDLNTDLDVLYKEIGKLVYVSHTGGDTDSDELDAKLREVDEKLAKIAELKAEIEAQSDEKTCDVCGEVCERDAAFCSKCGAKF